MTDVTVRLAIVGLGFMGRVHASNAAEFGHRVVAGADPTEDARREFSEEFDAETYEGFEAMFERETVDAVAVAAPNAHHEPAVAAALERGYHVLCEKPLSNTLAGAERIVAAAAESDASCWVNFHNRFTPGVTMFKAYQRDGRFGDIVHTDAEFVRFRGVPGTGSWFSDPDLSGGGTLIDIGVHAIDLALYLSDFPSVEEVFAVTRSEFGNRPDYVDPQGWIGRWADEGGEFEVEDSATGLIRCADDRTIALDVAWAANQCPSKTFVIRGTDAGAELEIGGDGLTVYEAADEGVDHVVESKMTEGTLEHGGWEASDEQFLTAVATGEAGELATAEEGASVQRVVDALYRSAESGTSVSI